MLGKFAFLKWLKDSKKIKRKDLINKFQNLWLISLRKKSLFFTIWKKDKYNQ